MKKKQEARRESDPHIRVLVLGEAFSGKTSFANTFPNILWINTDFGLSVVGYVEHEMQFKRGEKIIQFMHTLLDAMENKAGPFGPGGEYEHVETIVFDSMHKLSENIMVEIRREREGQKSDTRAEFGQLKQELIDIVDRLKVIPYHVVVTCAVAVKDMKEAGNTKSDIERMLVNRPDIEGSYRDKIAYEFDEVYLLTTKATSSGPAEHWCHLQPPRGWEGQVKSRLAEKGELPAKTTKHHFNMYKKYLERVEAEQKERTDGGE